MSGTIVLGGVVGLYVAVRAGDIPQAKEWVDLAVGVGVLGDRYAAGTGFWSDPRWPDQQVTFLEAEVAEHLAVSAGALRRNIVTRGIRLEDLIGTPFRVGLAELRGVRPCDPCHHVEELVGRSGLMRRLIGRGGLRAEVISAGRVCLGDHIVL